MDTTPVLHYLNPSSLEAVFFLRSLDNLSSNRVHIDDTYFTILERIIDSIEKLLEKKKNHIGIVATEKTKLIPLKEFETIQRVFHCTKCHTDLGKSVEKAAVHLHHQHKSEERLKRKATAERRAVNLAPLPKKAKALIKCNLQTFYADNMQLAETLKQIPTYDEIEEQLLAVITPQFPNETIKVYKFGSRISGVGTRNSDLDIFIDIGGTFHNFENRSSLQTKQNLQLMHIALQKAAKSWSQVISIESARVPIIRAVNVKSKIKCDIGVSNSLGFCNTMLAQYLFELQPILRRSYIFLKKWLERTKINDQLPSYAFLLMAIFYLQTQKLLPSIECLQKELQNHVNVGPWISNFSSKTLTELNIKKVELTVQNNKKFLQVFFRYYVNFDFSKYIICPYYGRPVEINGFYDAMPEHYKKYAKSEEMALEINKAMIVQDPFQLNHNVTKSLSQIFFKHIIHYFHQSDKAFNE